MRFNGEHAQIWGTPWTAPSTGQARMGQFTFPSCPRQMESPQGEAQHPTSYEVLVARPMHHKGLVLNGHHVLTNSGSS